jgi:hypothetical protein
MNSHGLRDKELSYEKQPDVLRILLLNASAVAGFEVAEDQTLDTQLEILTDRIRPTEVINGATRGYGTDQSLLFLESEGIRYQPDIIIYVISPLDFDDNLVIHKPNRTYGKSYFILNDFGELELRGVPVPKTFDPPDRPLMSYPVAQSFAEQQAGYLDPSQRMPTGFSVLKKFFYDHSSLYRLLSHAIKQVPQLRRVAAQAGVIEDRAGEKPIELVNLEWRIAYKILERMKSVADRDGARFALYEFSSGLSFYSKETRDRIEQLSRGLDIPLIESSSLFHEAQQSQGASLTLPRDGHWNANGHRLAARIIYEFLVAQGWLETFAERLDHNPPRPYANRQS